MQNSKMEKIAKSLGSDCEVIINNAEWEIMYIYWPIDRINMLDDSSIVLDAPVATGFEDEGFQYCEFKNDGQFNSIHIKYREAVVVIAKDDQLVINSLSLNLTTLKVFCANFGTKPLNDSIKIIELIGNDLIKSNNESKNRMMPSCPACEMLLCRPELDNSNINKITDCLDLAVHGKGILLGNCLNCEREYVVLMEDPALTFQIIKEIKK